MGGYAPEGLLEWAAKIMERCNQQGMRLPYILCFISPNGSILAARGSTEPHYSGGERWNWWVPPPYDRRSRRSDKPEHSGDNRGRRQNNLSLTSERGTARSAGVHARILGSSR